MAAISSTSDESDRSLLNSNDEDYEKLSSNRYRSSNVQILRNHLLFGLFHLLCFLIYFAAIRSNPTSKTTTIKKWSTEPESVEDYITYEDTWFNLTMFWNEDRGRKPNPYEGPLTPSSEIHWEGLTKYMRAGITSEENDRLDPPSVVSVDDSTVYPVVVAAFHHLHCLTRLRRVALGHHNPQGETEYINQKHTLHCIEDLRRSIMCMPDLTLYPLKYTEWTKEGVPRAYEAQTNVPHTCRNWDAIMDWAAIGGAKIEALPNFPPP